MHLYSSAVQVATTRRTRLVSSKRLIYPIEAAMRHKGSGVKVDDSGLEEQHAATSDCCITRQCAQSGFTRTQAFGIVLGSSLAFIFVN